MNKKGVIGMVLLILVLGLSVASRPLPPDPTIATFWIKFKTAVIKGDKATVAQLSRFPIEMPFGIPNVKTAAQLTKRFGEVFNSEADAARCFSKARPEPDPQNSKKFSVGCKLKGTNDEVIVYGFVKTQTGWKFSSFDNINE